VHVGDISRFYDKRFDIHQMLNSVQFILDHSVDAATELLNSLPDRLKNSTLTIEHRRFFFFSSY